MKRNYLFICAIGIILLCNTCSKEDNEISLEQGIQSETLSDEQVAFWDNLEDMDVTSSDIVLPNGSGLDDFLQAMDPDFNAEWSYKSDIDYTNMDPETFINLLIAKMNKVALHLTNRSNFVYAGAPEFGQPNQNGLAYSYGSRNYKERLKPPFGKCDEEVYGLDCSGFMYHLFLGANLDLTKNTWADKMRRPAEIEKTLRKAYPEMNEVIASDLGTIEPSEFESGDIIYWLDDEGKASHIGMVLKNKDNDLMIAQSNGDGKKNCSKNYGLKRGPRFVNLRIAVRPTSQYGFGDNYGVVRFCVEKGESPDYTNISAMVKVYGYYHETTSDGSRDYESDNGTIQTYNDYTGHFTGNTFNGSYTTVTAFGTITGTITAEFNASLDSIKSLSWIQNETSSSCTVEQSFTVEDIPKSYLSYDGTEIYVVEGETSCDHIISVTNRQTCQEGLSYNLTRKECTWGSKVWIALSNE